MKPMHRTRACPCGGEAVFIGERWDVLADTETRRSPSEFSFKCNRCQRVVVLETTLATYLSVAFAVGAAFFGVASVMRALPRFDGDGFGRPALILGVVVLTFSALAWLRGARQVTLRRKFPLARGTRLGVRPD